MDPDRARQLITAELASLTEHARWARHEDDEQVPDEGMLTQHPADAGTEVNNQMEQDAYARTADEQVERLRAALQRLDEGSYGRCAVCDRPIPDERLEARPEAERCIEHEEMAERRGR